MPAVLGIHPHACKKERAYFSLNLLLKLLKGNFFTNKSNKFEVEETTLFP